MNEQYRATNVWSNAVYVLCAILVLVHPAGVWSGLPLAFGLFNQGVWSALFHAYPDRDIYRLADRYCIFWILASLILYSVPGPLSLMVVAMLVGLIFGGQVIFDISSFLIVGIMALAVCVMALESGVISGLLSVAIFAVAVAIRHVSGRDEKERSHGWSHSAWHLASATAVYYTYTALHL